MNQHIEKISNEVKGVIKGKRTRSSQKVLMAMLARVTCFLMTFQV